MKKLVFICSVLLSFMAYGHGLRVTDLVSFARSQDKVAINKRLKFLGFDGLARITNMDLIPEGVKEAYGTMKPNHKKGSMDLVNIYFRGRGDSASFQVLHVTFDTSYGNTLKLKNRLAQLPHFIYKGKTDDGKLHYTSRDSIDIFVEAQPGHNESIGIIVSAPLKASLRVDTSFGKQELSAMHLLDFVQSQNEEKIRESLYSMGFYAMDKMVPSIGQEAAYGYKRMGNMEEEVAINYQSPDLYEEPAFLIKYFTKNTDRFTALKEGFTHSSAFVCRGKNEEGDALIYASVNNKILNILVWVGIVQAEKGYHTLTIAMRRKFSSSPASHPSPLCSSDGSPLPYKKSSIASEGDISGRFR